MHFRQIDDSPETFMLVFETGDAADLADEFGALILFGLTLAFLIWQYVSIKRMAAKEEAEVELVASSR